MLMDSYTVYEAAKCTKQLTGIQRRSEMIDMPKNVWNRDDG